MFYKAYIEKGFSKNDAIYNILTKNIYGIDIDENATIDEVKKALAAGKAAAQSDMAETQMATIKEVMAEIQENNSLETELFCNAPINSS